MSVQVPMKKREVVTAFLRYQDRILLLRRSGEVGTYQGRWAGVSGYLDKKSPMEQVRREIREETGLTARQLRFVAEGEAIEVPAPEFETCWVVHPFLFDIKDPRAIRLDSEHEEQIWLRPEEVTSLATVPSLVKALARCLDAERQMVAHT